MSKPRYEPRLIHTLRCAKCSREFSAADPETEFCSAHCKTAYFAAMDAELPKGNPAIRKAAQTCAAHNRKDCQREGCR